MREWGDLIATTFFFAVPFQTVPKLPLIYIYIIQWQQEIEIEEQREPFNQLQENRMDENILVTYLYLYKEGYLPAKRSNRRSSYR